MQYPVLFPVARPLLFKAGPGTCSTKDLFSLMLHCVKGRGITVITLVAAAISHSVRGK